MLLCILIRWVVFVVNFRDEFSTICQSFIVFVMREGVTVRNLKTDSNSEFGWPNTVEERARCARGASWPKATTCGPRVPHGPASSLATCGTRWPHVEEAERSLLFGQFCPSSLSFKDLSSLHFHNLNNTKSEISAELFLIFIDLLWS